MNEVVKACDVCKLYVEWYKSNRNEKKRKEKHFYIKIYIYFLINFVRNSNENERCTRASDRRFLFGLAAVRYFVKRCVVACVPQNAWLRLVWLCFFRLIRIFCPGFVAPFFKCLIPFFIFKNLNWNHSDSFTVHDDYTRPTLNETNGIRSELVSTHQRTYTHLNSQIHDLAQTQLIYELYQWWMKDKDKMNNRN